MTHQITCALVLASLSGVGFAQDGFPISTDRPSFADGTSIIPKGRWQIETGYTFTKVNLTEFQTLSEVLLRLPLHDRLEVRFGNLGLGAANLAGGGGHGLLDPWIGLKYRIQTGATGKSPDLALIAQTTMPAGSRDFRVPRSQPSIRLAGYFQADPSNGFGAEVGYSSLGPNEAKFDQWAVSGYWSRTINARAGAFVELYRLMPASVGGPTSTFADAGVTYLLDKATQVDFRIGSGLNQQRDGWFIGAGVAFRF